MITKKHNEEGTLRSNTVTSDSIILGRNINGLDYVSLDYISLASLEGRGKGNGTFRGNCDKLGRGRG